MTTNMCDVRGYPRIDDVLTVVVVDHRRLCVSQDSPFVYVNCRCDVCDCGQDDGRKTVSEQGVQRITSKETAQT